MGGNQVSPAIAAVIVVVVLLIVAVIGWKVFGKHGTPDNLSDTQRKAYMSTSAQGGGAVSANSAGHLNSMPGGAQGGR